MGVSVSVSVCVFCVERHQALGVGHLSVIFWRVCVYVCVSVCLTMCVWESWFVHEVTWGHLTVIFWQVCVCQTLRWCVCDCVTAFVSVCVCVCVCVCVLPFLRLRTDRCCAFSCFPPSFCTALSSFQCVRMACCLHSLSPKHICFVFFFAFCNSSCFLKS